MTDADYQRRYRQSEKGKATRRAYRERADVKANEAEYARRRHQRPEVKARHAELAREDRANHPEREHLRRALTPKGSRSRLAVYGMSPDDYARMVRSQEGCCAICGEAAVLQVDHHHASGIVRALLCGPCNRTIGHAREDPWRLRRCADYIEHRADLIQLKLRIEGAA